MKLVQKAVIDGCKQDTGKGEERDAAARVRNATPLYIA